MVVSIILAATLLIAFANGANDNFKGVATLFGSKTVGYKKALVWATVTTFLGSLTAVFLSQKLIRTFSGKGLVPDSLTTDPYFLLAVILGAGLTVLFAARFGIPISTTHSLTGALAGAGLAAIGTELAFGTLGKKFFYPLLVSPVLALALTGIVYLLVCGIKKMFSLKKETCLCVGERIVPVGKMALSQGQVVPITELRKMDIFVDEKENCEATAVEVYAGRVFGVTVQSVIDSLHFLSAGAVSFARGLNDTPKIVALSVAAGILGLRWNIFIVAIAMLLGGWIMARRVAETMSQKITPMTHGQGLTANLITAFLVIVASRMGVPVSTTHVSCGAIFGIGLAGGKGHWYVMGGILGSWVLTLPVAALLSAGIYFLCLLGFSS